MKTKERLTKLLPLPSTKGVAPLKHPIRPQRRPTTEEISALIERVTFHNDESGFCVLRVKARGQRERQRFVGLLRSVTAREMAARQRQWAVG